MNSNQEIIEPTVSEADTKQPDSVEQTSDSVTPVKRRSGLSRFIRWTVLILAVMAGVVWFAMYSARQVPDFYAEVLETDLANAHEDGQEFERNLVKLQNTAVTRHPWLVEITQDQVNGWFMTDLKEKFPDSLPANIEDPRAVFTEDTIRLAFKYSVKGVKGIVVLSAEVFCTDNPNEIAVQVNEVKTGVIPLPVGPWLEQVADSIRGAGIPVFWSNTNDNPLAIFTIPEHITSNHTRHVEVQAIDLQPGRLVIAGKTNRQNHAKKNAKKPNAKQAKTDKGKQPTAPVPDGSKK